ncbi:UNVERIFIED_CONTAM: hypothetical protein Sindi_1703900 [Sesamum indicum]
MFRVRINNALNIQSFLLPHWKWFIDYASVGNRIWVAWDANVVDVHILDSGNQFMHCRVTNRTNSKSLIITVVYGASKMIDRRNLWTILETLEREHSDEPWLVGGDFNAVREMNEVCGISGDIRMAMEEFNAGIQEAGLIPLPMQGEWYTRHNCSTNSRSLWKRLDRILINDRWLARFPSSSYHSLLSRTSDHSPLVLHGDTQNQTRGGMFRFDNYLTRSPEFIPNVQNIWQHRIIGTPMFAVTQQRRKKGDLTLNVQLAKGFLDEAQDLVRYDRQKEVLLQLEHCCRIVYAKAVKQEQIMLQQQAKMQWMKGGDQCSRIFFHKIAQRRVARRILQINDHNGTIIQKQQRLSMNSRQTTMDIGFLRPWGRHVLSNEETNYLITAFTPDDVKNAVFDIAEDNAPGPDGYSSGFFKAAWLVHTPMTVGDFRPISCCNVLYKIIAKLLVKRLSGVLDNTISPCQGAFIPGRSIGDNILLAQELLTGYNQDFFAGARGLRQGDPLSPYLFVLIMEVFHLGLQQTIEQDMQFSYHWKEPTKIFQLGFADDLLLFCKADLDSLRLLKMGLHRFADWSGLRLNIHRSHVIISRSAQGWKDQILAVMGFQEGQLPMRYLGLPLLSSRLTINDCQPLLLKIDARINGWEGISLSYAGRIQIIKSVLSAMSTYWASAFILPKTVTKQIEKRLRNFLWKGNYTSGYAKMCRTSIWVEWLKHGRLRENSIWRINEKGGSWGWRKILHLRRSILPMPEFIIGEGNSFFLWKDPWHHLGPLITRFSRGPRLLGLDKSAKLQVVIDEGQWQWPLITDLECMEIIYTLPQIHGGDDRINWRFPAGRPTTQSLYRLFSPPGPNVGWYSLLSGSLKIPRHNFILWLAIQEKLPTTDKPWMNHLGGCILCDEGNAETHTHMFFRCRFSRRCLAAIRQQVRFSWPNREWARDVEWASRKWRGKHIVNIAYRALLGACIYHIWRERNLRRFEHTERTSTTLSILITEDVRQRILNANLAKSVSTCALYRLWRIPCTVLPFT